MIANGIYLRQLRRPLFWEQSSALVHGGRIWETFRRRGGKVGLLFWQQSLGEEADLILSPAPIHKHHGGLIEDCYGRPPDLYGRLRSRLGEPFDLSAYWGPRAAAKSARWITSAAAAILYERELAPDLCMVYLPTLDYDLQRFGPASRQADDAFADLSLSFQGLLNCARDCGYEVLVFGDYAMGETRGEAVFPNRALLKAGLMQARRVRRSLYPDFHASRAFAMADHEVAHVYVREPQDVDETRRVLTALGGVGRVLDRDAQRELGLDHPNSGELVLAAADGRWFAYPWWNYNREAPEYATHVDIHNKPGYDPCELLTGFPPWRISLKTARVRGSHGRTDAPGRLACWGATCSLGSEPASLQELAGAVRTWLAENL